MSTMTPVSKDSPLSKAWEAYKATDDYANTKRWATVEQHTEGSLWAAFVAGFNARLEAGEADTRDAERYRFLRDNPLQLRAIDGGANICGGITPQTIDLWTDRAHAGHRASLAAARAPLTETTADDA